MNHFSLSRLPGLSRTLLAVFAAGVVFTAGCANMETTAIGSNSMVTGGSLTGRIHGGNQPVGNAQVSLWTAGQGIPGTGGYVPPAILATVQSANDGTGSFTFAPGSYSCPTSPAYVYLTATGGNTLNTGDSSNNKAAVFLAPLGLCSSGLSSLFINMTEVTTVATMAALQQYFTPGPVSGVDPSTFSSGSFSTDGTGRAFTAMGNSFALISNMISLGNGIVITSSTLSPTGSTPGFGHAGTTVTVKPETAKINALANVISACINNATNTAQACTDLFSNAAPPNASTTGHPGTTFSTATDVLQALYYMLINPSNGNTTRLNKLYSLIPASAPYQPTLSAAPSDWTIALVYSSNSTCGANSKHLIYNAQDLAVDAYGNIWIGNNETGGNLSQISPTGMPYSCVAIGSGATTSITIDSLQASGKNQNIWVADSGSNSVFRYQPGLDPATAAGLAAFSISSPAMAIAADNNNNIYFTSPADRTLYTIPSGATVSSSSFTLTAMNTSIGSAPAHVMVDSASGVWTTSGASSITRTAIASPYSGTQISTSDITNGLAITGVVGGKNYVYVGLDGVSNSVQQFWGNTSSYASQWTNSTVNAPAAIATDGAQNLWGINSGSASLVAIGANQQAISPASTGILKDSDNLGAGNAIVIDSSGNVWVGWGNNNAIVEIVGAAVPVYQPYSLAIGAGRFQIAP